MIRKLILLLGALAILSCMPMHGNVTPELRKQFLEDLEAGKLTLVCQSECNWAWMGGYDQTVKLYRDSRWKELAEQVMRIGMEKDIAYYFLGSAAEGLGYHDAAFIYYQRSLALYGDSVSLHHCGETFSGDGCAGVDLGSALLDRIAAVQESRKARAARERLLKGPFGYLVDWTGKDPVKDNLWSDPKVMPGFRSALGKHRTKQLLTGWGKGEAEATPMKLVGENMVFTACKPEDRCRSRAVVFINLRDGAVEACWQDATSARVVTDRWFGPKGKSRQLPTGYCEGKDGVDEGVMFDRNSMR